MRTCALEKPRQPGLKNIVQMFQSAILEMRYTLDCLFRLSINFHYDSFIKF